MIYILYCGLYDIRKIYIGVWDDEVVDVVGVGQLWGYGGGDDVF